MVPTLTLSAFYSKNQTQISIYRILRIAGIPKKENKQMKCFWGHTHGDPVKASNHLPGPRVRMSLGHPRDWQGTSFSSFLLGFM